MNDTELVPATTERGIKMKQYKEYMDGIQASDTLHRRLTELEAPAKRPAAWKRYGGAAAALLLVCGLGGFGAWTAHVNSLEHPLPLRPAGYQEVGPEGDLGQPDIAPEGPGTLVEPGESQEPGMKTIGGYEVQDGEMASYFMLPYLEYSLKGGQSQTMMDWALPQGSTRRDLTPEDIAALFGGADTLSIHLNWGSYELSGWAAWLEDGSLWGAFLNGYKGPMDHFELAFTAGDVLPPTCIAYGGGVVNEIWGVPVTASGFNGESGCDRRVEFLHNGYGFRFGLTATDRGQAEELVSRITRWLIVEGVETQRITSDGAVLANPWEADPNYSVGEPNWNDGGDGYDSGCPYCADGTAHSHPYDPKGQDDPHPGDLPHGTVFQ